VLALGFVFAAFSIKGANVSSVRLSKIVDERVPQQAIGIETEVGRAIEVP